MSFLLSVIQFNLYVFWLFWSYLAKHLAPVKSGIYSIFPQTASSRVISIKLVDTIYKKLVKVPPETKLKSVSKHSSWHEQSFLYIEYELKDAGKVNGDYCAIIRGGDKESLCYLSEYLEKTSLFEQYLAVDPSCDLFIDCIFTIEGLGVEIDKTQFFNKLIGVDRAGHRFLKLHHERISIKDIWKTVCILDGHLEWVDEKVNLFTLDMNLRDKRYSQEMCFTFSSEERQLPAFH